MTQEILQAPFRTVRHTHRVSDGLAKDVAQAAAKGAAGAADGLVVLKLGLDLEALLALPLGPGGQKGVELVIRDGERLLCKSTKDRRKRT